MSTPRRPVPPTDIGPPVPPTNVRIELFDGREIPVDCLYVGIVDGYHQWEVVNAPPSLSVRSINITTLPGYTGVVLPVVRRPEG